ncbi:MAG TPA: PH domain-containing protein [Anaerolineae bacterium]|nr:PH domain-containing protein [Anaerolineae bacterium]
MSYVDQLLAQNENVVLVSRQSWVVLVREIILDLLLALVAIGITLVAVYFNSQYGNLAALLLLIPAARFVVEFIHWYNREYIVTNRRVIQVNGIVNKNVIDSSLEKVNDVRMSQSVLGRLLNYGDVEILTASELGTNLFRRISNPIGFKTAMLNEKEKLGFESEVPAAAPVPKPSDVPTMIASLNALRSQGLITEEEFQKKKAELLARM